MSEFAAGRLAETSSSPFLRGAGLAALAAALPLFILPFAHLGRYGNAEPGRSYMDTTTVADRGVYGLVRHPQYLGYVLMAWGLALIWLHWITVSLAAVATAAFHEQAREEERHLRERMGATYDEYAARVPRFNLLVGAVRSIRGRRPPP